MGGKIAEGSHYKGVSRSLAAEIHRVEIDEVEHIIHIHCSEVDAQRVGDFVGSLSVYVDILLSVFYLELVNGDVLGRILYARCYHVPLLVANVYV